MLAGDLMTTRVVTLSADESVEAAARKMVSHAVSGCPVVGSNGRLVGIFTESDVLNAMKGIVDEEVGARYLSSPSHSLALLAIMSDKFPDLADGILGKIKSTKVGTVMTRSVVTAAPGDHIEDVVGLMVRHNVNRIPIVEGGVVKGIVSRADITMYVARKA